MARFDMSSGVEQQPSFYLGDALGSVNHVVDWNGNVVNNTLTNAWGEELLHTQSIADRYGFTQRERDTESGGIRNSNAR